MYLVYFCAFSFFSTSLYFFRTQHKKDGSLSFLTFKNEINNGSILDSFSSWDVSLDLYVGPFYNPTTKTMDVVSLR